MNSYNKTNASCIVVLGVMILLVGTFLYQIYHDLHVCVPLISCIPGISVDRLLYIIHGDTSAVHVQYLLYTCIDRMF